MEYMRDYFNDNILEYIGDKKLVDIIDYPWFDLDKFQKEYDDRVKYSKNTNKKRYIMDEDDNLFEDDNGEYDENGDDFEDEYIIDYGDVYDGGIYDEDGNELEDFDDYIKGVYGGITVNDFFNGKSFDYYFDVDEYISYNGESESRCNALSRYDGEEDYTNGYYIYSYK